MAKPVIWVRNLTDFVTFVSPLSDNLHSVTHPYSLHLIHLLHTCGPLLRQIDAPCVA